MNNNINRRIDTSVSDFKNMIMENSYYVDKTLFIKELLEQGSQISLILRPRRFGKTLNMSMLKYFFDCVDGDASLFNGLNITKCPKCMEYQGKYPVIFVSFKSIGCKTWEDTYSKLRLLMQELYTQHEYILNDKSLNDGNKEYFKLILNLKGQLPDYYVSLKRLSYYLYNHFKRKVIVLIDEYDTLLQSGFANSFYDNAIDFTRNWLGDFLKDNSYLKRAVLTGILRVSKESVFSGLNNIQICSPFENYFSTCFGLTTLEVRKLLEDFDCSSKYSDVKEWYDGYVFGHTELYNTYSVMNYIKNDCQAKPYWTNTSENIIIREILRHSDNELKRNISLLMEGNTISTIINTDIVYKDMYKSSNAAYGFLVLTGYLKVVNSQLDLYEVCIPNKEIMRVYAQEIADYLIDDLRFVELRSILDALLKNDLVQFMNNLQSLMVRNMSFWDNSESFYHGFMLGILSGLNPLYEIKSNRESGYGRFDVMLIPRMNKFRAIIMEFKYSNNRSDMESDAHKALKQIDIKQYEVELDDMGITNTVHYGIAFHGKDVYIATND